MALVVFLQEDEYVLSVYRNLKFFVKRPPESKIPLRPYLFKTTYIVWGSLNNNLLISFETVFDKTMSKTW